MIDDTVNFFNNIQLLKKLKNTNVCDCHNYFQFSILTNWKVCNYYFSNVILPSKEAK